MEESIPQTKLHICTLHQGNASPFGRRLWIFREVVQSSSSTGSHPGHLWKTHMKLVVQARCIVGHAPRREEESRNHGKENLGQRSAAQNDRRGQHQKHH